MVEVALLALLVLMLTLSIGVSDHTKGKDVRDALTAVDARVQIYTDSQAPGGTKAIS